MSARVSEGRIHPPTLTPSLSAQSTLLPFFLSSPSSVPGTTAKRSYRRRLRKRGPRPAAAGGLKAMVPAALSSVLGARAGTNPRATIRLAGNAMRLASPRTTIRLTGNAPRWGKTAGATARSKVAARSTLAVSQVKTSNGSLGERRAQPCSERKVQS